MSEPKRRQPSDPVDEQERAEPYDDDEDMDLVGELSGDPDVLLDVPLLKVDEIHVEVDDLRARVSLQAEVLDLLRLNVGADVVLGKVELDIKGVEAQALLKVRLDRVAAIVGRVLTTIDRNPQILERLTAGLGEAVGEIGHGARTAVGEVGRGARTAVGEVGRGAGTAVGEVGRGTGRSVDEVGRGAGRAARDVGRSAAGVAEGVQDKAGGITRRGTTRSRDRYNEPYEKDQYDDTNHERGGDGLRRRRRPPEDRKSRGRPP